MLTVADGLERESEGEGENLLALNSSDNPNNATLMEVDHAIVTNFLRETGEENSNHSINLDTNLNSRRVISENLNSKRGYVVLEGGEELVDSLIVKDGKLMGLEEGVGEPTFSVLPKQNVMRVTGRRGSTSVDLGQLHSSNNQLGCVSGDAGDLRGGVYSDGPRADVGWVAKDPVGLSGGLLVIWNSVTFNLLNNFSGEGFLGISVEKEGDVMHIVNIYSPCSALGKKKLWEDLLALKQQNSVGEWCVGGDFNAILHSSERKGSSAVNRRGEKLLFNRFVEEMEVVDVPVLGKKISWFSADGKSMSRIDRFLYFRRRRKNQLVALKDGDQWIEGVEEVKGCVKNFYADYFQEKWLNRPNLNGLQFQTLSDEDNLLLMAPFSSEEVKEAIWSSDGNKCPGPDGFNFTFLKACWEIIKGDIIDFLHEFYNSAILPKAITASFLSLIPKKDHLQTLSDYRPISLVYSLYKILSKVLAARLKKVLGKVISTVQSAFLPNRQILDGVLVVNELIDLTKRKKDKCLLFKVDFERAYDTVNWHFLDYMMVRMGFAEGWRRWIHACVCQSSKSVLVNGNPTEEFSVGKGLRQGDPMSPFLFLIVAEGLSGLMNKAVGSGSFHGYKVNNNLMFHTLQFADDTIIVGEGNWDNLWTIKTVLRSFELVSGLKVNFFKSKLYGINLDDSFLRASSSFLHCGVDSIPFRFLGIPVGANPRRKATWLPIIDSMKKRLGVWNSRLLSIRGRVTLINSVLSSLPLYFFSFFKAPVCVLKEMVSIQRNFLWGGGMDRSKICWVSWDSICQPKDKGGLGIKNLESFNDSLLCKWKWRCLNDLSAYWFNLLHFRYGSFAANFVYGEGRESLKHASIWWRDLWKTGGAEEGGWFVNNISSILGDGNNIAFWKEKWLEMEPLSELYPSLFQKSTHKDALAFQIWGYGITTCGLGNLIGWKHLMMQILNPSMNCINCLNKFGLTELLATGEDGHQILMVLFRFDQRTWFCRTSV
ncbi:unnamed protein product [Trifolium pratense]|uniref:Uncharacterized protein n=1 Tax=Trifolium pratense TaxID=57577 RepID=A0ACB0K6W1_TRIPR|nr:unnamed protein product [Trifolium pratense]